MRLWPYGVFYRLNVINCIHIFSTFFRKPFDEKWDCTFWIMYRLMLFGTLCVCKFGHSLMMALSSLKHDPIHYNRKLLLTWSLIATKCRITSCTTINNNEFAGFAKQNRQHMSIVFLTLVWVGWCFVDNNNNFILEMHCLLSNKNSNSFYN